MTPYVGEIRMFGGTFDPLGWEFCDGRLLDIASYDTLFNLIGTTYGGDGQTNFAVPDLRGRAPTHQGQGPGLFNQVIGEMAGTEFETLTVQQIPVHSHALLASTGAGGTVNPQNNVLAASPSVQLYIEDVPSVALAANAAVPAGGSQPHENRMPYLVINYIIATEGIFPSPT